MPCWALPIGPADFGNVFHLNRLSAFFDYIVYVWGKAYIYTPHILDNEYDSYIGALVSDTFSIPATATMVAVFNLRWPWWLVIGALYFGVEELFIKFGLYQQLWWKTLYTFWG